MRHFRPLHHRRWVRVSPLYSASGSIILCSVKLDGCILGKNTRIGAKAELSKCVTQAGYEVEGSGKHLHSLLFVEDAVFIMESASFRNEKLDVSDWTVPDGTSDEDESGESDDGDDSS